MINETVGNLIQAAAEEATLVDSGNPLSTAEQTSAIDRLQRLIDRSNIDRALIYGSSYQLLTLTANKQSYTIGVDPTGAQTADFSGIARPTKITRANLLLSSTVRRPITVTTDENKWAQIRYQQIYGPPQLCYYDQNFSSNGFANLFFFQIPDAAYQWEYWAWQQNPIITSTANTINYPPGYAAYWLNALAIALCPMFGRTPPAVVVSALADAKQQLLSMNSPSPEMRPDPALAGDGGDYYNWLAGVTDDYFGL